MGSRFASEDAAPTDSPNEELGDGSKTVRPPEKQDDKLPAQEIFVAQKGSDIYKFPATPEKATHKHETDQEHEDDTSANGKLEDVKPEAKKPEPVAAEPKEEPSKKSATETEDVSDEVRIIHLPSFLTFPPNLNHLFP